MTAAEDHLVAGDAVNGAFGRLFDRHSPSVLRFAQRRLGAGDDAAFDVVSETFLAAWRHQHRCPSAAGEQLAWLYAIAGNVVRNQLRSRRREYRLAGRVAAVGLVGTTRQDVGDHVSESHAFSQAFARLSPTDQEVLRLLAWDGLESPSQVAVALGISVNAAGVRIHRARRRLQHCLVDPSALGGWSTSSSPQGPEARS